MRLPGSIIALLFRATLSTAFHTKLITEAPVLSIRAANTLATNGTISNVSLATNQALRILPIGDSITWGYGSSDGNGYRQRLLDLFPNNPTTFIGSQHSGNMTNDNTEGYSGRVISEISSDVAESGTLKELPNVVLLMVGTNDMNKDDSVSTAPKRLASLVDEIQTACPEAVILVSEVTPIRNSASNKRAQNFNAQIPALAAERQNVVAINMSKFVPEDDLVDGLHPGDSGYDLMAQAWFDGIQEAAAKGLVRTVLDVNSTTTDTPTVTTTSAPAATTTATTKKQKGAAMRMSEGLRWSVTFLAFGWAFLLIGL